MSTNSLTLSSCFAAPVSAGASCLRLFHGGLAGSASSGAFIAEPLVMSVLVSTGLWSAENATWFSESAKRVCIGTTCCETPDSNRAANTSGITCMQAALTMPTPGPVHLCGITSSSFDVARYLSKAQCFPVWASVLALSQRKGRGQLGRDWVSPPGNIYASVRLPLCDVFMGLAAAPAIGILVAQALRTLGVEVWVKWPNDLVMFVSHAGMGQWQKVGGILLEERQGALVAGIGLNFNSAPSDMHLRKDAALGAGVVPMPPMQHLGIDSPCMLWLHLVTNMYALCNSLTEGVPLPGEDMPKSAKWNWLAQARRHLAFIGQQVRVLDGADLCDVRQGRLMGLDDSGGLVLHTGKGVEVLHSGSLQIV